MKLSTSRERMASQLRGRQNAAYMVRQYITGYLKEFESLLQAAEDGTSDTPMTRDELEFMTGTVEEFHAIRVMVAKRNERHSVREEGLAKGQDS